MKNTIEEYESLVRTAYENIECGDFQVAQEYFADARYVKKQLELNGIKVDKDEIVECCG